MADRKLQVTILGDSRSFEKAIGRANKATKSFGSHVTKLGKIAAVGVGAAFAVMALALKRGFGEFAESQKVMAQTAAVLASTGGAANVTAKHVDSLAGALSRMSSIDDEAIAAGANMLLTFTNIKNAVGKGPKIFDEATRTILDMSVAMGKDLPSTAIMVGKALNDTTVNAKGTITGWSALRRVGVMVTPALMDMAAALIKAGKPMEAQKLLLRELQTEFGGSARAYGKTFPGAMAKLRNATDELTGAFAKGLAPIVKHVATLLTNKMADPKFVARVQALGKLVGEKLHDAFVSISTWFQAHWGDIQGGFRTFVQILKAAWKMGGQLKDVLLTITAPLRIQFKILLAIWDKVLAAVSVGAGLLSHVPGVGGKFAGVQGAADAARDALKHPLGTGAKGSGPAPASHPKYGRRAHGGPVYPGVSYLVGERGPEYLTMGRGSGFVSPNGGGGVTINGPINLPGVRDARQFLEELQRIAKNSAGQTRGRHGGSKLALG